MYIYTVYNIPPTVHCFLNIRNKSYFIEHHVLPQPSIYKYCNLLHIFTTRQSENAERRKRRISGMSSFQHVVFLS